MILVALLLSMLAVDQEEDLREAARRGDLEKAKAAVEYAVLAADKQLDLFK